MRKLAWSVPTINGMKSFKSNRTQKKVGDMTFVFCNLRNTVFGLSTIVIVNNNNDSNDGNSYSNYQTFLLSISCVTLLLNDLFALHFCSSYFFKFPSVEGSMFHYYFFPFLSFQNLMGTTPHKVILIHIKINSDKSTKPCNGTQQKKKKKNL